jgi:hypothetical protein
MTRDPWLELPAALAGKLPTVAAWIDTVLSAYAREARPTVAYGFPRLARFYSRRLLAAAKVVEVARVPFPPLRRLGVAQLTRLERGSYAGITLGDTYFVRSDAARDESLHAHELVHVVQWQLLGREAFLKCYAAGFLRRGYRDSPLEAMAYRLQDEFDAGGPGDDFEARIRSELASLPGGNIVSGERS